MSTNPSDPIGDVDAASFPRGPDRASDRATDRATDRAIDRVADHPAERTADHTADHAADHAAEADDPYLWLEDVHGERAMAWVRERNAATTQVLQARDDFAPTRERLLQILDSKARIPAVTRRGAWLYNLWQDDAHPRGLWRRTTLTSYRQVQPDWHTVLDLDALGAAEGENWVWAGVNSLGASSPRCLVSLSRGGADASVVREFDLDTLTFVVDGFELPEAKSTLRWIDLDQVYVGTDFGPGSLTDSGYPRVIKRWRRGTPLADAVTVFEGDATDVAAHVTVDRTPGFRRTVFGRRLDFFHERRWLLQGGRLLEIDLPTDAGLSFWNSAGARFDQVLIELRSDWTVGRRVHRRGSLLAADAALLLDPKHRAKRRFHVLFEPTATRAMAGHATTRTCVLVQVLDQIVGRLEEWQRLPNGYRRRIVATPLPGSLGVQPLRDAQLATDPLAEHYLLSYSDYLTPDTLYLGRSGSDRRERLKSGPAHFDARGMRTEQCFAISADGTRVPYFVVWPSGARALEPHPTLLYGYGGFEISLQPAYAAAFGSAWCARGGVLVVANIRGGGEFGPAWHQAALKAHKHRSHDDFIAVAQDLIERGITTPRQLGIEGGSNGGLLVGAVFTQRPELFNAVVCKVPLLDMRRYHRLLAGASWMAEYGNPDLPADWAFIASYSPYHNLRADRQYPKVLFTTSTRDDRVHPGHARKMAARMLSMGHEVMYFENIEGGHGGAADNAQRAAMQALEYSYLWQQLAG